MDQRYIIDDRETPRFRVNRRTMVDPEIFKLEQERIFDKCWLYVGHDSELPKKNDFKTRNVGGRPIIFTRKTDGSIGVFINSCTHRGAMLCREKEGNGRFLRCFYHAWSFDTSGNLVAMPDDESYGPNFDRDRLCLVSPPKIDSYRGFVFVSFDKDAVDLVTYLAGAAEQIDLWSDRSPEGKLEVVSGSHEYSMRANWKLLVENSLDGYHGAPTHQRYGEMAQKALKEAGMNLRGGAVGGPVNLGNGHAVGGGFAAEHNPHGGYGRPFGPDAQRAWNDRWDELDRLYGKEWAGRVMATGNMSIFPNMLMIGFGQMIRILNPISPEYMEITMFQICPVGEDPALRAERLSNALTFQGPGGMATPDDVEALEACGVGFHAYKDLQWSDISRGMAREAPLFTDEYQMRTFWRQWNKMITGEEIFEEPHDRPFYLDYKKASETVAP